MNQLVMSFMSLVLVLSFSSAARAADSFPWENFKTLETYGDSITAGFFANRDLSDNLTVAQLKKTMTDVLLTLHRVSRIEKFDRRDLAWPAKLVDRVNVKGLKLVNHAQTGATVLGLLSQVKQVKGVEAKAVAFFFIGHNDVCKRPFKGTTGFRDFYSDHFDKAIREWSERHKDSLAFLVPIVDVGVVMDTLWKYEWTKGETCRDTYLHHAPMMCPLIARHIDDGKKDYSKKRTASINDYLKELPQDKELKLKSNNRLIFLEHGDDFDMTAKKFAIDCFHLNEDGQLEIAKAVQSAVEKIFLR